MATQQLVEYIQHQLQQGVSPDEIKAALQSSGWSLPDIEEAYRTASTAPVAPTAPSPLVVRAKTPIVVGVISLLMFIGGVITIFASISLFFLAFAGGIELDKGSLIFVAFACIGLLRGVGYVVISVGLRRMRRWALYAFTVLAALSAILDIMTMGSSQKEDIEAYIDITNITINAVLLIYFWAIAKKFTKKI